MSLGESDHWLPAMLKRGVSNLRRRLSLGLSLISRIKAHDQRGSYCCVGPMAHITRVPAAAVT